MPSKHARHTHGSSKRMLALIEAEDFIMSMESDVALAAAIDSTVDGWNEPFPSRWKPGWIYTLVIEESQLVKIGFSADGNLKNRIATIQSSCPFLVKHLFSTRGTTGLEHLFHALFRHQRMRGEWFKVEGVVEQWLAFAHQYSTERLRETANA